MTGLGKAAINGVCSCDDGSEAGVLKKTSPVGEYAKSG